MTRLGPMLAAAGSVIALLSSCGGVTTSDSLDGGVRSSGGMGATASRDSGAASWGGSDTLLPNRCSLPLAGGDCDGSPPGWGHDPRTGLCTPLGHGCDGNDNQFDSLEACQATCRFSQPNFDSCTDHADCVLTSPNGCDQRCEPLGERDFVAIATSHSAEFAELNGCAMIERAACASSSPLQITGKFLYAACVDGECTVRDTREQPFSECTVASDCRLRCGTGCCSSCGAGEDVIAVRADADLRWDFCGAGDLACPACDCVIADAVGVGCVAGRCEVTNLHACTPGNDASCNHDAWRIAVTGICGDDGQCTCLPGRAKDPSSGRCY